jgi:biopolymer transport protein ExbD
MSFKNRKKSSTKLVEQNINITPLMDVLTVLLFFLIKIFNVNSMSMALPQDIELPTSKNKIPLEESVALIVSKKDIRAEEQVIVSFKNMKLATEQIGDDGRVVKKLEEFLKLQMSKRNQVYEGIDDPSKIPPGKLLIHADKKVPFGILKHVFHTATVAGYSDYQFLTMNET